MKFVGVIRSMMDLPAQGVQVGDLLVLPYIGGGWSLAQWGAHKDGAAGFQNVGGYDDLTDALLDVVHRYHAGPVALDVDDGEARVTVGEFLEANPDLEPAEVADILKLAEGETYTGGGGAAAEWTVTAIAGAG